MRVLSIDGQPIISALHGLQLFFALQWTPHFQIDMWPFIVRSFDSAAAKLLCHPALNGW